MQTSEKIWVYTLLNFTPMQQTHRTDIPLKFYVKKFVNIISIVNVHIKENNVEINDEMY